MGAPYGTGRPVRKIIVLAEAQNWHCCYCYQPMHGAGRTERRKCHGPNTATVDHFVSKHAGGKSEWANEVAACMACNSSRGHFSAILFWLLMRCHDGDRAAVSRALRRLSKKQRARLKCRLNLHAAGQIDDTVPILPPCPNTTPQNDQSDRAADHDGAVEG